MINNTPCSSHTKDYDFNCFPLIASNKKEDFFKSLAQIISMSMVFSFENLMGKNSTFWNIAMLKSIKKTNIPDFMSCVFNGANSVSIDSSGFTPLLELAIKAKEPELIAASKILDGGLSEVMFITKMMCHRFGFNYTTTLENKKMSLRGFNHILTYPELTRSFEQYKGNGNPAIDLTEITHLLKTINDEKILFFKDNEINAFSSGWKTHSTSALTMGDYFLKGNRGSGHRGSPGIGVFKIGDNTQYNFALNQMNRAKQGTDKGFFVIQINEMLKLELITHMPHKAQSSGNCSYASAKLMIRGVAFLQMIKKGYSIEDAKILSREFYKSFTQFDRQQAARDYMTFLHQGPHSPHLLNFLHIVRKESAAHCRPLIDDVAKRILSDPKEIEPDDTINILDHLEMRSFRKDKNNTNHPNNNDNNNNNSIQAPYNPPTETSKTSTLTPYSEFKDTYRNAEA